MSYRTPLCALLVSFAVTTLAFPPVSTQSLPTYSEGEVRTDLSTAASVDSAGGLRYAHPPTEVLVPLLSTSGAIPFGAPKGTLLGVDARHGFDFDSVLATGGDFDSFRETIASMGVTIVPLQSFTNADISGLDAIVLLQPYSQNGIGFTSEEIPAIHDFVNTGGGLLVLADGGTGSEVFISQLNALVAPYGVAFNAQEPTEGNGHSIEQFVPHAVTEGISRIGVDYQRRLVSITDPALDLTPGGGADDALAVADRALGRGNLVFLSDSNIWFDPGAGADTPITFADNRRLLENVVTYLLSPLGLETQPRTNLTSSGFRGGPFVPSSAAYTLSNATESPLEYRVSKSTDWVSLDDGRGPGAGPLTGTLPAGESLAVSILIDGDASSLPIGRHSDTILFDNTTDGRGSTARTVTLEVLDPNQRGAITNGDFETGDLRGWTPLDSGSGGWAIQDGQLDPPGPDLPIPPCEGRFSAMSFQDGPGRHTLLQEIDLLPAYDIVTLSWADRIRNHAEGFLDPDQEFRVEILDSSNRLMRQVYSTNPGDLPLAGCVSRSFDISEFAGQTILLAFTQEDNLFYFNLHLDDVKVTLRRSNQPPVAVIVANSSAECTSPAGASVVLDASSSTDSDSSLGTNDDIVEFEWHEDFGLPSSRLIATGEVLSTTLSLGQHSITLRVTDSEGESSTAEVAIRVIDTLPPALQLPGAPTLLWPPNHRLVRFDTQAQAAALDACDPTPGIHVPRVTSDEPDDAPGAGDGHTRGDIQGEFSLVAPDFWLRAERDGNGNGREYTVYVAALDRSGNLAEASFAVLVPHDQGGVVEPVMTRAEETSEGTLLRWSIVPDALFYAVVRGDLRNLRQTEDAIDLGDTACVEALSTDATTAGSEDPSLPEPGEAFFYVVEYHAESSSSFGTEAAPKPRVVGSGGCAALAGAAEASRRHASTSPSP